MSDTLPLSSPPQKLDGHRILIVESEVGIADELGRLMGEMGHVVQLAADAKSALFGLQEFEPHLVLLGTYLADMPGYELSAILRGAPQYSYKFRHVGLLYVADRHKLLKYRFVGAPDVPISQYIFKPLDGAEVRDKVARALHSSVMG
ncbi:Response regulator receiver domain-containing protein [Abditibacterium utsteinense]|uniref:Response regulator receiver domain-containing protein n=1 Tax=Abditibacterium utsteinense TaxID=1960156 RepID=A0A2S8SUS2_9BACT|nr:response regulator [Abditibacterium utsteinense]PQV64547.1 Response regulator receiver domain-containing protein [Abditibacterium utsteinense]